METGVKEKISNTIEKMFAAGAHYAYSKTRRHPTARSFIFGKKNTVEIFDLEKTKEALERAREFAASVVKEGRQILFVGNKGEARRIVRDAAVSASMPYVAYRWVGGTLTNFSEIRKRVERLEKLRSQKKKGELEKYTKRERLLIDRDIERLEKLFDGIVPMEKLPGALFVVDSRFERTAVKEANQMGIPVISVSNSDCDMSKVAYPVPANDTTVASIGFFVGEIARAVKASAAERTTDSTNQKEDENKDKENGKKSVPSTNDEKSE